MKKIKPLVKATVVSGLVVASTAAITFAATEAIENRNSNTEDNLKLVVEKVDNDTARVAIDNIKEIPKSLQFSIKLDGAELQTDANGEYSIKDLITKEIQTRLNSNEYQSNSNSILTDYTYNPDSNTIDVLITAENSIPKNLDRVDVFEIDVTATKSKKASKNNAATYKVTPNDSVEYKYLSNTNKEYVSRDVDFVDEGITMNTAPTIELEEKYISVLVGESIELTPSNLGIKISDDEGDDVTLEVKDGTDVITEFTKDTPGVYNLTAVAVDSYGGRSEEVTIQIDVVEERFTELPTISKGGADLEDITINAGDSFNPMKDVIATAANGEVLKVELSIDKELDLDPDKDTEYRLTYTAIDRYDNRAEITITLTVKANKAPVISGVKDHNLKVGDSFEPTAGVTVTDEDADIKLEYESNVNTSIPGEYKVSYSATDSGNKTTRAQSKVTVSELNTAPIIEASDRVVTLGEDFNPLEGVRATDKEEGDLTHKIKVVKNNVVASVEGKYTVTYSVEDSKGEKTTKTITVTVKSKVILADRITISNKFDKMYLENEKIVKASVNNEATIKDIEWTTSDPKVAEIQVVKNEAKIIAKSQGQVTITASTKDGSNKSDSFTIDIVEFKDDSKIPSYIVDVIDTNILLPIAGLGDGTENAPLEFEMRNITVAELDKFLDSLNDLKPVVEKVYNDGEFVVYKIKITERTRLFTRLFRKAENTYIEVKVDNGLSNADKLKDRLNKLVVASNPEKPTTPEKPSTPGNSGGNKNPENPDNSVIVGNGGSSSNQGSNGNSGKTEDTKNPDSSIALQNEGESNNQEENENSAVTDNKEATGETAKSEEDANTNKSENDKKDADAGSKNNLLTIVVGFVVVAGGIIAGVFSLKKKK